MLAQGLVNTVLMLTDCRETQGERDKSCGLIQSGHAMNGLGIHQEEAMKVS